jgi:transcriptional regulator GlxA family with amidase domain
VHRGGAGLPDERRGAIERWVAVHHGEQVGLDDLAAALGLSRSTASRAVRTATGRSLPDLLGGARLTTAQALLGETDLAIVDVAIRSGFGDRSHFHRCFKAAFGVSPSQWRRQRDQEI